MTSKQGQCIPAEVGGTLSPAAAAMYELVDVIQKNAPPMLRHSGMAGSLRSRHLPKMGQRPVLSLFEPSTEIIRKGKAGKPNEFGKIAAGGRGPDRDRLRGL
jgi:hypothetical protein